MISTTLVLQLNLRFHCDKQTECHLARFADICGNFAPAHRPRGCQPILPAAHSSKKAPQTTAKAAKESTHASGSSAHFRRSLSSGVSVGAGVVTPSHSVPDGGRAAL